MIIETDEVFIEIDNIGDDPEVLSMIEESEPQILQVMDISSFDDSSMLDRLDVLHQDLFILTAVLLLLFCRLCFKSFNRR